MLDALLADDYERLQFFVSPSDCGHAGMRRPRTYIIFWHRQKARHRFDVCHVYDMIKRAICATVSTKPSDYLIATRAQLQADAARVANVRRIPLRPVPGC